MLVKRYGPDPAAESERRYSPPVCIGTIPQPVTGRPDPGHISTSFVERQNWTVRTTMRRYTRLSNGFSRKIENHMAAVALNYFAYNFIKIHSTLRMTPAMASGVSTKLWDVADLVDLLIAYESKKAASAVLKRMPPVRYGRSQAPCNLRAEFACRAGRVSLGTSSSEPSREAFSFAGS